MRRVLKYSLIGLAGLLVALTVTAWFVLATEAGTAFAWRQAQGFLPEGTRIENLDGRLAGPLVVERVEFRSETLHLALDRVELDWSPTALLSAVLRIDRLDIAGLRVTQTGASPEPEPSEPFRLTDQLDLPLAIRVREAGLTDFQYRSAPGAAPFVIDRAVLAAGIDREGLAVDRLTVRAPLVDIDGSARLTTGDEHAVEGRVEWLLRPPGYAPVDAETRLDGTLRSLVVTQTVASPYNARVEATLTEPLDDLGFDTTLSLDQSSLQAIRPDLPPIKLSADGTLSGSPSDLEMRADIEAREPQYGTVTAAIRGHLADQTVTLEQVLLELAERPSRLQADGAIKLAGEQPDMDLALEWEALRWPLDGEALVTSPRGKATVTGSPQDLSFSVQAEAEEPRAGRLDLALDGRFTGQVVQVEQLSVAQPEGPAEITASGQVTLDGEQPRTDLTADWRQLRWPLKGDPLITSPSGKAVVQGTPADLSATLEAGVGDEGRITGDVTRQDERIDLALDWRELEWPLDDPRYRSPQGSARLHGVLDDYSLAVDAGVELPEQAGGRIDLEGRGSLEALTLSRIDIQALEGNLTGTAEARWSPGLSGAVDLEGEGLNPGPVLAEWPGRLGLGIKARAANQNGRWTAELEQVNAAGALRGHDVSLEALGGYDGEALDLERFTLASGDTRVQAKGRVGPSLDLAWQVNSNDLGQLLPDAGGRLNGEGTARGPLQRPRITADVSGSGIEYAEYALNTLKLDADVDVSGGNESRLSLLVKDGRAADIMVDQIRLTGGGDAGGHNIDLSAQTSRGAADLSVEGEVENPWQTGAAWAGRLTRATLEYPELAPWQLKEPAKLRVDTERTRVSRHCWGSGEARLCLEGERGPDGLAAQFSLDQLDFEYFAALMPPDFRAEGAVSGSGELGSGVNQPLAGKVELRTTPGRFGTVDADDVPAMVAFSDSDIRLDLGRDGMQASVDLRLEDAGGAQLNASVPAGDAPLMERPLNGRITAEMPELAFVADLIPEMESFDGRLEGDMKLGGSLNAPVLDGQLALVDGAAVLAGPGLELSAIRIDVTGRGERGLGLEAGANSGGGSLKVRGEANLAGPAPTADLAVRGQDFQVLNTSEAQVYVSPDLEIKAGEERIDISGEVRIPRADITPHKIPTSAVTVSGDQVIIRPESEGDPQQVAKAVGRSVHSKVRVILGERVRVEGFGLKARLTGDLQIVEQPGEPIKGSGEIKIVKGQYKAYGQDLTIENGRVLFPGGPITEPGLDVRAVRQPQEDIVVGVDVRGNLREPDFKLFSEPSMTQQEQLSYLVLGRSLQETSGAESSAINQAALALGLKSTDFLAKNLGGKLGVDEVEVETTRTSSGTKQAALVLGKYLSPDLYISYGLGLFEPVSTVKLQYAISSRWKVVTESSSTQSSGDIIYTIERGK